MLNIFDKIICISVYKCCDPRVFHHNCLRVILEFFIIDDISYKQKPEALSLLSTKN